MGGPFEAGDDAFGDQLAEIVGVGTVSKMDSARSGIFSRSGRTCSADIVQFGSGSRSSVQQWCSKAADCGEDYIEDCVGWRLSAALLDRFEVANQINFTPSLEQTAQ